MGPTGFACQRSRAAWYNFKLSLARAATSFSAFVFHTTTCLQPDLLMAWPRIKVLAAKQAWSFLGASGCCRCVWRLWRHRHTLAATTAVVVALSQRGLCPNPEPLGPPSGARGGKLVWGSSASFHDVGEPSTCRPWTLASALRRAAIFVALSCQHLAGRSIPVAASKSTTSSAKETV